MDNIYCRQCGTPYVVGEAQFCAKCGTPLPESPDAKDEIKAMEKEERGYEVLRFTAALVVFLGIVFIVVSWVMALLSYPVLMAWIKSFVSDGVGLQSIQNIVTGFALMMGLLGTLGGIGMIAWGQMMLMFAEIRDDVHTSTRLLRRLALMISK